MAESSHGRTRTNRLRLLQPFSKFKNTPDTPIMIDLDTEEKEKNKTDSVKVGEKCKTSTERGASIKMNVTTTNHGVAAISGVETLLEGLTMEEKKEQGIGQTRMENTPEHAIHEVKRDEDISNVIDLRSTPRYTRSMIRNVKAPQHQASTEKTVVYKKNKSLRNQLKQNRIMAFFPIVSNNHWYVAVFNLKTPSVVILDNKYDKPTDDETMMRRYRFMPTYILQMMMIKHLVTVGHPAGRILDGVGQERLQLEWLTTRNFEDLAIFAMRPMETYMGLNKGWRTGLVSEGPAQDIQLADLRVKYAAKILLSNCNRKRAYVVAEVEKWFNIEVANKGISPDARDHESHLSNGDGAEPESSHMTLEQCCWNLHRS